jgi:DNA-binding protein Fis
MEFPKEGVNFNLLVKKYEGLLMDAALKAAGGFKNTASALLGVNRTTFQEKLRKRN